jgi:uncharacterized protein involved in exopolysaccharide biosynthesis
MSPNGDSCRRNSPLGAACFALSALLAGGFLAGLALPREYIATARVLLAPAAGSQRSFLAQAQSLDISVRANGASRVLKVQFASSDPRRASERLNGFVRALSQADAQVRVIDEASVPYAPRRSPTVLTCTLLVASLAFLSLGMVLRRRGRSARRAPALPRSTVRAALGLAREGRTPLLVQTRSGFRLLEGAAAMAHRSEVHVIGAAAGGSVIVARTRRRRG